MITVTTSLEIAAPPEAVWAVLTDFDAYPAWNPFWVRVTGEVSVGARLHVGVRPPLGLPLRFTPRIVRCDPPRELQLRGQLGWRWLAHGEHRFEIVPHGRGVRFVHSEEFGGVLPRLLHRILVAQTRRGFDAMNRALATRAALSAVAQDPRRAGEATCPEHASSS
jgi:hypothetical protein